MHLRFGFPLIAVLALHILVVRESWAENSGSSVTKKLSLAQQIEPWHSVLSGNAAQFTIEAKARVKIDRKLQDIQFRLDRFDDESFNLSLTHEKYAVEVVRRADQTYFALPKHKRVFFGKGPFESSDVLSPKGIVGRLISKDSSIMGTTELLANATPSTLALSVTQLFGAVYEASSGMLKVDGVRIQFSGLPAGVEVIDGETRVTAQLREAPATVDSPKFEGMELIELPRKELERAICRGVHRATEILAPGIRLKKPSMVAKKVSHGELRWVDGHRVVLLSGTPQQIGAAHGELLKKEAVRCIESVLYSFGVGQTIHTGKWFRHELDRAYARLAPHIPERHKIETRSMANSLNLDPKLAETLNVFPELFHCSGFAVFGKATSDGKLYHGRVLDYMTTIGLQDSATTFIIAPEGKNAFANVGYAGFIGSVTGMNDKSISLGEMGGRGEGKWDGVPMATLMRRALEECSTLDEVMDLWKSSPRTCEYYYVFADGKTNRAVGVAAFPDKIEFVYPGQSDERIGEGIPDAVVLSAGSRLKTLRERVLQEHGKIDVEKAKWLMSRPVAMQSNLHNALFVPEDGILFVANASHSKPAAECKYVRLDLGQLLRSIRSTRTVSTK